MKIKSVVVGAIFEQLFFRSATSQGISVLRIPDGCKVIGRNKIVRVKTPADYLLAKDGRCILIDTKTQGAGKTFPKANINMHQVLSMTYMAGAGVKGGYIVFFRDIDRVVFYDSEILRHAEEGLHNEKEGIYLGTIEEMNLERIFSR